MFYKNGELVYCNVVEGLLQELGCAYTPLKYGDFL
jgi:hypothetical protein